MIIRRGDVVLTNLDPVMGSEQGKIRPCLIIQNDLGNKVSPTTIIAAITSKIEKEFPFTVCIQKGDGKLPKESMVLCNHLRTISSSNRIIKKIGTLKPSTMKKVDEALKISLELE